MGSVFSSQLNTPKCNLARQRINDKDAKKLADELKRNRTVTDLDLSANEITGVGASLLFGALSSNTCLSRLNFSSNYISSASATVLAASLQTPTCSLVELRISKCALADPDAVLLAKALKFNPSLQSLCVSHNCIAVEGAAWLAEALKVTRSLRVFDISYNHIEIQGALAMAEAIKSNTTLQNFDVSFNEISDEGCVALAEALVLNTSLCELGIADHEWYTKSGANWFQMKRGISERGMQALADALRVNTFVTKITPVFTEEMGALLQRNVRLSVPEKQAERLQVRLAELQAWRVAHAEKTEEGEAKQAVVASPSEASSPPVARVSSLSPASSLPSVPITPRTGSMQFDALQLSQLSRASSSLSGMGMVGEEWKRKSIHDWNELDVGDWLQAIKLHPYVHTFAQRHVNGPLLLELNDEDLETLIVDKIDRKRLLVELRAARQVLLQLQNTAFPTKSRDLDLSMSSSSQSDSSDLFAALSSSSSSSSSSSTSSSSSSSSSSRVASASTSDLVIVDPGEWNYEQVSDFLCAHGLGQYAPMFQQRGVNGEVFLKLQSDQLRGMGVADEVVRNVLLSHIRKLKMLSILRHYSEVVVSNSPVHFNPVVEAHRSEILRALEQLRQEVTLRGRVGRSSLMQLVDMLTRLDIDVLMLRELQDA
eukprot:TRINITY_DN1853_c0_g2_i4.p1 TRINITY_DN1853_c0_g2~~TRINITY_DN1853_c0_g2_i4.p1  ORF type:complete len:655 (+),score=156.45 TRINITY_DN1853_c0_g2_i4:130-2094(+)